MRFKIFLLILIFPFALCASGVSGLHGVYKGEYRITMRAHPVNRILGFGVKKVPWTWDFDKMELVVKGTTLSVGFNYALHDLNNADPDNEIIYFVDNGNGTYTISCQFQIYHPGLGNPRTNTKITFEITKVKEGILDIKTIDIEKDGGKDGILGTQIVGVFPLTVEPSLMGSATIEGYDQNGDGISDEQAVKLGLDPSKTDNDGDGISDVDEIGGDFDHPKDSDGDGTIDALEAGKAAYSSNSADVTFTDKDDKQTTISLNADEGNNLSNISVGTMAVEKDDASVIADLVKKDNTLGQPGLEYSLGNVSFTLSLGSQKTRSIDNSLKSAKMKLTLGKALPEKLLVYAKDTDTADYALLSKDRYKEINATTIELTLYDGDSKDLDGEQNNKISTSVAIAENTLGQGDQTDESAGAFGFYLVGLLLLLAFKKKSCLTLH